MRAMVLERTAAIETSPLVVGERPEPEPGPGEVRIPIRPHLTTFPLVEANRALSELKQGRLNGTGVLVVGE